jgi:hypothetical protein
VQSAGLVSERILQGDEWDSSITVEGYESKPGENMNPYFNSVSPGYFSLWEFLARWSRLHAPRHRYRLAFSRLHDVGCSASGDRERESGTSLLWRSESARAASWIWE